MAVLRYACGIPAWIENHFTWVRTTAMRRRPVPRNSGDTHRDSADLSRWKTALDSSGLGLLREAAGVLRVMQTYRSAFMAATARNTAVLLPMRRTCLLVRSSSSSRLPNRPIPLTAKQLSLRKGEPYWYCMSACSRGLYRLDREAIQSARMRLPQVVQRRRLCRDGWLLFSEIESFVRAWRIRQGHCKLADSSLRWWKISLRRRRSHHCYGRIHVVSPAMGSLQLTWKSRGHYERYTNP